MTNDEIAALKELVAKVEGAHDRLIDKITEFRFSKEKKRKKHFLEDADLWVVNTRSALGNLKFLLDHEGAKRSWSEAEQAQVWDHELRAMTSTMRGRCLRAGINPDRDTPVTLGDWDDWFDEHDTGDVTPTSNPDILYPCPNCCEGDRLAVHIGSNTCPDSTHGAEAWVECDNCHHVGTTATQGDLVALVHTARNMWNDSSGCDEV